MQQRVIITGAPSSGKSSLIECLKEKQFQVFPEAARLIINQELNKNSSNVPWMNNKGFSELVLELQIEQFKAADTYTNFYDRGIPDVFAYFSFHKQTELIPKFKQIANEYLYHSTVFLLPPWKKIYTSDGERKESYQEALLIHDELIKSYTNLGYKIIEVPLGTCEERANFILQLV